jgi:hypothetical protein
VLLEGSIILLLGLQDLVAASAGISFMLGGLAPIIQHMLTTVFALFAGVDSFTPEPSTKNYYKVENSLTTWTGISGNGCSEAFLRA